MIIRIKNLLLSTEYNLAVICRQNRDNKRTVETVELVKHWVDANVLVDTNVQVDTNVPVDTMFW